MRRWRSTGRWRRRCCRTRTRSCRSWPTSRRNACPRTPDERPAMNAPRILLLGADGQLGTELRRSLGGRGDLVAATRSGRLGDAACETADFSRPGTLPALLERVAPGIVVNAAAHT